VVTTGADGSYTMDLAPGTYTIQVKDAQGTILGEVTAVQVTFGLYVAVDFTIKSGVKGKVTDSSGAPIANLTVEAIKTA